MCDLVERALGPVPAGVGEQRAHGRLHLLKDTGARRLRLLRPGRLFGRIGGLLCLCQAVGTIAAAIRAEARVLVQHRRGRADGPSGAQRPGSAALAEHG